MDHSDAEDSEVIPKTKPKGKDEESLSKKPEKKHRDDPEIIEKSKPREKPDEEISAKKSTKEDLKKGQETTKSRPEVSRKYITEDSDEESIGKKGGKSRDDPDPKDKKRGEAGKKKT